MFTSNQNIQVDDEQLSGIENNGSTLNATRPADQGLLHHPNPAATPSSPQPIPLTTASQQHEPSTAVGSSLSTTPHPRSNLSNQLADIRRSYQQSGGSTPPVRNIPPRLFPQPGQEPHSSNSVSLIGTPPNPGTPSHSGLIHRNSRSFRSALVFPRDGASALGASSPPPSRSSDGTRPNPIKRSDSSASPSLMMAGDPLPSSYKSTSRMLPTSQNNHRDWIRRPSNMADLTDEQKAHIVRRHLMTSDEQQAAKRLSSSHTEDPELSEAGQHEFEDDDEGSENDDEDDNGDPTSSHYPTPFHLQGGDIHHAVYKWANKRSSPAATHTNLFESRNHHSLIRPRSVSVSGTSFRESEIGFGTSSHNIEGISQAEPGPLHGLAYKDIMEPGGFRRAFLYQKRAAIGQSNDQPPGRKITKSFIDFLSLYGHFGGEDLEEIDEGDEEAFQALNRLNSIEDGSASEDEDYLPNEHTQLLAKSSVYQARKPPNRYRPSLANRRGLSQSSGKYPGFKDGSNGNATVNQAILMLLKSLVGTGVLFLAKAFSNGGMLFSIGMIVFISMISLYSYVLLVETRLQIPGGFGEIGGILYGPWCRNTILFSLVISQLGFVSAYTIFIAQNLQAFVLAVTDCKTLVPIYALIFGQLIAYLPLAMIRNIQKLSGTALIADVFILIGLLYVFGFEIKSIAQTGLAPIVMFNPQSFPLMVGTAVFAFEGIGLVIPITESMKEPQKFPAVLTGVIFGLTILFAGAGAGGYAAFGSDVQTVVLVNLPQEDKFVNAVQFLYSMAIMLSTPLQLFPAVRIMENGLFSQSGKYSNRVKWQKNSFRVVTVVFCALVAWAGASDLDKFVSLIGSVACVPLCFCYPAMLHYKAIAKTARQKTIDIALFVFGVTAAVYTTYQTLDLIASSESDSSPKFGKCS